MRRRKTWWVYIWMPNFKQCFVEVTDDITADIYRLHLNAELDRKRHVGLVYSESFSSERKARASERVLMRLDIAHLRELIEKSNPWYTDFTPESIQEKAHRDALAPFSARRTNDLWSNDEESDASGGIGAYLPRNPVKPRIAAYEQPWPPTDEYTYEELRQNLTGI